MADKREYIRFDWAIKRILHDKTNKEVLNDVIAQVTGLTTEEIDRL